MHERLIRCVLGSCASPCNLSYLPCYIARWADESCRVGERREPMSPEARERSFDELARGLASGGLSRRRALKLMGAALVGSALASLGIGEAAADAPGCKRNGKKCRKNHQCCSGNCVGRTCSACPSGRVLLSNGTCALPCGAGLPPCPDCSSVGRPTCASADTGGIFCSGDRAGLCAPGGGCPTGQFCSGGACFEAC
jgi:hypothetical protein